MATVGQADIEVGVNGVGAAQSALGSLGGTLTSLGRTALAVGAVGLAVLGTGLSIAASEAMEAQKVMAQTNAVIESTKGAAGQSANAIADMATNLQNMSGVADDVIQAGENMLLTFTNIGSNVFPQATQTMLDMSVALGQDMKSSAIQLGKALNDPIAGITALQRVGVAFTASQKAMIASMVKAGDLIGAQKVILAELSKEFGGSAAAAGATFAGQMEIAKLKLLDVAEAAGNKLLPSLSALMTAGFPLVEAFALGAANVLASFGDALVTLTPTINGFMNTLEGVFFHLKAGWSPLMVLGQLFPSVFTPAVRDAIEQIGGALARLGAALGPAAITFLEGFGSALKNAFGETGPQIVENLTAAFNGLAAFFENNLPLFNAVGQALGLIAASIVTWVSGIAAAIGQLLAGDLNGAMTSLGDTFTAFANSVSQAFGGVDFSTVLATWGSNLNMAGQIISGAAANAIAAAGAWASGVLNAISGGISSIPGMVSGAFTAAINGATSAAAGAVAAGAALGQGLANGIKGMIGAVINAAVAAVLAAIDAAKAAAGIQSPSKVMRKDVGMQLGAGMALGIGDMMGTVMSAMAGLTSAGMQPAMAGAPAGGASNVTNRGGNTNHNYITIMAQSGDQLQDLMMQAQQLQGDA